MIFEQAGSSFKLSLCSRKVLLIIVGFKFASGTGMFTVAVIVEYMSTVEASPNSAIKPSERPVATAELKWTLNSTPAFAAKSISSKVTPIDYRS